MTAQKRLLVADRVVTARGAHGNAVLVADGKVAAVGDASGLAGPGIEEVSYDGGVIVPGLRDAHFHPVSYAASLSSISLKTATDFADVVARLETAAAGMPADRPIVAIRLDDESLAEGALPTRQVLDTPFPHRPVLMHRYCGHIAVTNSAALVAAGVDADTGDPPGGSIDRDRDGHPTGVLRETAIELVSTRLGGANTPTSAELVAALTGLAGLGLTSIGAMVGCGDGPWATLGDETDVLARAAAELPIRVHAYVIASSAEQLDAKAAALTGRGRNLRWAGLKRFADGSLGGHTAAMHAPFADEPDETGTMRLGGIDATLARHALEKGGGVAIHAIGDRACSAVIDLFAEFVAGGVPPDRLRLEHASVLTARDIARIADLGIFASVQPAFMGSETAWLEKRVGHDRLPLTYPLRSLLDAGARLAGGSDCPVEPPHPLLGMALARDRAGIYPSEGLDGEQALALFTDGAAAALGEPLPLAPGSPADIVVLDRDPVAATPDELRHTGVLATYVAGEVVDVPGGRPVWRG